MTFSCRLQKELLSLSLSPKPRRTCGQWLCMQLLLLVYKALIVVGRSEWTAGLETLAPKVFQRTENENQTLILGIHRAIKGW